LKQNDAAYLDLVLEPIRVCAKYKPKFGQGAKGGGLTSLNFKRFTKVTHSIAGSA